MNKTWIIAALLAAAGVGGYAYYQSNAPVSEVMESDSGEVETPAALEEASEAAGEAVETVTESVTEAVEEPTEAVETTTEAVTETATEAVETATETVTETATEAAETATEAVTDTTTEAAVEMATEPMVDAALTAEGFDAAKVIEMIDGSDLGVIQKTTMSALVEQASEDPDLVESVLTQVKEALGL
ncbi:hypothetical protein ACFFUT_16585 [Pseudohalocynthiibacter aestuariivivens]|jgi:hypothetical protein|uniref:Translation initiation factor 3 n=1 Tax=Pseudohalocynthiibacter aestuariivivens TaxID=1591409 RepID=A0ABV5JIX3_9RHOB|nr:MULTISPECIES: hypothetical protein [Pseudohalocynthiibacter]MBS9716640.1 hypothetical protein [Pseudohalocynthiibacter aestuariivivens]MCK0101722.1 hypothetical protein [Pseudohalocynthiibacter sp. F2068]